MVDLAYAWRQPPGGGSDGGRHRSRILPLIVGIFAIFYFLLIRPQQKQRRERETLLRAVKKGDRVVTTSGMHGTVVGLDEHTVTLRVGDQVKLDVRPGGDRAHRPGGGREGGRRLMRRNLWLRIGIVVVVIVGSLVYLYPPPACAPALRASARGQRGVLPGPSTSGLDLQGGIHLVLGVDLDKALEAQVERAADSVRADAGEEGHRR